MNASTDQERIGITGLLVISLVVTLLAGAVLVRLVGEEDAQPTSGITQEGVQVNSSVPKGAPRPGNPAPDFTLSNLEGQPVSLSDWRGHPILINFWATWCGPCEVEMPDIQAAYEAHQEDGLVVLAIAVEDSAENARRFFEKHSLTFQALMDDGVVSRTYQVFGLPTSFFVGADGNIVAVHSGVLTVEKIAAYLARSQQDN